MVFKNNKIYDCDGNEIHYVATTDENTFHSLKSLGFKEIYRQGNKWFFINRKKLED